MAVKDKKPWLQTPLIESANLSKAAGCRIFLKLEHLQPGGSFKSRGIGYYCSLQLRRAADPNAVHFYSSSGGNAGIACVHAANFLGRPATVVVPMSTKPAMIAKIRAAGAREVVQHGASWKEADAHMREVVMTQAEARGDVAVYVPPFDHPDIWHGHSTLVSELQEQLRAAGEGAPDVVACSVGGGGLFAGVVQGIEAQGTAWDKTTTLAVETLGAESLAQSLEKGEMVTLPGITSLATSLGAVRVADGVFDMALKGVATGRVRSAVLTDAEAAMGCWRFADDERVLVELACGVSVALCYGGRLKRALGRPVRADEKVVIVVCGGQNVSTSMIEQWKQQFGDLDAGRPNGNVNGIVPSAVTAPNGS